MTNFAGWLGGQRPQRQTQAVLQDMLAERPMHTDAGFGLTADAVLEAEDARILMVTPKPGLSLPHRQHLLASYRSHGANFLARETQPESLVLIDAERQSVLLATDPIGLSHIYYAQTADGLVFGSSADIVIHHPEVDDTISRQSVFDYVYYHHCPSPGTIYQSVKKLECGQCLHYHDGQITLSYYWQPAFQEPSALDLKQAGAELQQLLRDAVKSMAIHESDTGAFLSGGLDSSSVAGALAQAFPGQAQTFSIGFPVQAYNEIEYARLAANHFNTRQHEYFVTPEDTVKAVPLIAAYYDEPFGNSSALAAYYCAKLAKDNGIKRLLAGDGGDEIFAGNERYAKQMLFEHYHRLPRFMANALETSLNHLPTALAKQKLPFKAKRYIEQAKTPMPDRLQDYNYLHRHDITDIFQADFLAAITPSEPLRLLRDCYWRPENASTLNRMLYMDWKITLHDNDLVKVNRMCELAGVEVCYPLLDQRILDLSLKIPSASKLNGQKLRWFYKQAMADFLPEPIINKSKHGFGLPFGVWLKDHQPLKELAYDAIHSLKKRDYFQPAFLDQAIDMHQSIHAGFYGELIWVLMMLELWFAGKGR